MPCAPCGIEKSRTALVADPLLLTVADDPAAPVLTVPTAMVAFAPSFPALPSFPAAPLGKVRFN